MLNMVKKLAKAIKGITRPKSSKVQITIPRNTTPETVLPAREELTARMIQALQTGIDTKLKAFLNAVAAYPNDCDVGYWHEIEGSNLVDAAKVLGFSEVANFDSEQIAALCAAIENYACDETTIESVAEVVEKIDSGDYTFLPEVYDDAELGDKLCEMLIENDGWRSRHNWLLDFVDWEEVGSITRNDEGGRYTERGYFQFGTLEY